MKKIITIAAMAFLSLANVNAQTNNTLVVFTEGGEKIHLILNGLRQNDVAATNVKAVNLNQNAYKAKIIFENKGIPDLDKTLQMMWEAQPANNMEFVYSIKKDKKGGYKWKFVSTAPNSANSAYASIPASVPGSASTSTTSVSSTQPASNVSSSTTVTTTSTATPTTTTGVNMGVGVNGTGFNINMTVTDPTMSGGMTQSSSTTTTTTTTTTSGSNTNITTSTNPNVGISTTISGTPTNTSSNVNYTTTTTNNSNDVNVSNTSSNTSCAYAMGSSDFASAKKSIESKSFEDSKLTIAKQILNSNCLNAAQVKEIMTLFSYESTKLDWAKFAYKRTIDKNNYFKLNDAFTYETSIDELNEYISNAK